MELSVWFYANVPSIGRKDYIVGVQVDHYFTSLEIDRFRIHGKYRKLLIDYRRKQDQPWTLVNGENEPQAVMEYVSLIIPQIEAYLLKWRGSGQVSGFLNVGAPKDWGSWPGYK
jgi:hypothetical protein